MEKSYLRENQPMHIIVYYLLLFANKGWTNKLQSPNSSVRYLTFPLQAYASSKKKKGEQNPEATTAPKNQNQTKPKIPKSKTQQL